MWWLLAGCLSSVGTLPGDTGPTQTKDPKPHDSGEDSGTDVERKPESLRVAPTSLDLGPRDVGEVSATLIFDDGSETDVTADATWTVKDTTIAGVWTPGEVRPLGPGSTRLVVSYASFDGAVDVSVSGYATPRAGELVFNEVLADPPSGTDINGDGAADSVDDEFVEIVNVGEASLDLAGATLWDSDNDTLRHLIPGGTTLQPGEALVVFGAGSVDALAANHAIFQVCDDQVTGLNLGLALSNDGDTVTLKGADGAALAAMIYGAGDASDEALQLTPEWTGSTYKAHGWTPGTRADGTPMPGPDGIF